MADTLCYTAEKSLREAGDKVPKDVREDIEGKVKAVKDIMQTASKEDLEAKTQELSASLQKIGEHLYKDQQPEATGTSEGSGDDKKGEDDGEKPVEGEVVDGDKE